MTLKIIGEDADNYFQEKLQKQSWNPMYIGLVTLNFFKQHTNKRNGRDPYKRIMKLVDYKIDKEPY